MSTDVRVQVPSLAPFPLSEVRKVNRRARVVELADSLDSGSSAHYGRAGSSPASRTKKQDASKGIVLFFLVSGPPQGVLRPKGIEMHAAMQVDS